MRVRILPIARERLLGIWRYTTDSWGEEQADRYIGGLVEAVHTLPAKRDCWRPVRERRFKGIYFFRYRHHYIFFRLLEDGALGVLSVLHENMDLPDRLTGDIDPGGD